MKDLAQETEWLVRKEENREDRIFSKPNGENVSEREQSIASKAVDRPREMRMEERVIGFRSPQLSSHSNLSSSLKKKYGNACLFHWVVCVCVQSLQSCLTLCDTIDCCLLGSSVHGILQGGILEWAAIPSSGGIFLTQRQNPYPLCLLHSRWILRQLSHLGKIC